MRKKIPCQQLMLRNVGAVINNGKCCLNLSSNHSQLLRITLITAMNQKAIAFTFNSNVDAVEKCFGQVLAPKPKALAFIHTNLNEIAITITKAIKMVGIKALVTMPKKLITTGSLRSCSKADVVAG